MAGEQKLTSDTTKDLYGSYSEYWRRNKSALEPLELANALKALRKVVGYVGANCKTVEWAGMSEPGEGKILIDVSPSEGKVPIPGDRMDVMVGQAIHEALHCREWSDWIWLDVESKKKELFPRYKSYLKLLVDAGEDVYVDHIAKDNVLGNYVTVTRAWYKPKGSLDNSSYPNTDGLIRLWRRIALYKEAPEEYLPEYEEPLKILIDAGNQLIEGGQGISSVAERASCRSEVYVSTWDKISPFLTLWDRQETERIMATRKAKRAERSLVYEGYTEDSLSPQLAQEVAEILAATGEDMTPLLESELTKPEDKALRTIFKDATIPYTPNLDYTLVARLRRIFQAQWERTVRTDRGLISGRVDGRRLYRVSTTGRVFRNKAHPLVNVWSITVLLDASISMGMAGTDWLHAQNTCAALWKALQGYRNKLDILAYHEDHDVCRVSKLFHHRQFFTVTPCGRTPSGQAVMIAAMRMSEAKRKLLIHITDGECNCGSSVQEALNYCQRNSIELVTLGFGLDKELVKEQYGESSQLVDSIKQVPEALEIVLKKKLLRE
ncbi:MAG: hypothetical protein SVY53_13465 [Chloroflexota bacterium]|nr:hypothetical protein [Chloroflexota bacterium]